MRGFRKSRHRTILTCTVIAFGFGALTTLAASAAPSHAGDATRVIRFSGHNIKKLRHFRVAVPSTMSWTNSGPVSRFPATAGTATRELSPRKATKEQPMSPQVAMTSFGYVRLAIGRSRFAPASRKSPRQSGSTARARKRFRPSDFVPARPCTGLTPALAFRSFLPAGRRTE